ncbi:CG0192-related protein [Cellulomonas chengniuliangii]|uniref:CG0192-related protein n=1 Tax=Cellulomonas chengniuliangii TaxID=2968084 RepID=UPI001D0E2C32|nr:hypothetical protein [Cellulomonas chengniuliangii]MCC2318483.1 hypothetical protein [Cellulomonas chengniuliangii]
MALLHRARLHPTKLELLAEWLPEQQWFSNGAGAELALLGSFRLDDPAGEVGVEVLLIQAGDAVFQTPLTYRGAPLPGGDAWLVGTMEHSVLGRRWVYDACGDPVFAGVLVAMLRGEAAQAEEVVIGQDGTRTVRAPGVTARVTSAVTAAALPAPPQGAPVACATAGGMTTMRIGDVDVDLRRVLDVDAEADETLPGVVATWPGQGQPVLLATARRV